MIENHLLPTRVYFPSSTSASEPGSLAVRAKGVCLLLVGAKAQLISCPGILHPIMHIKAARISGRIH